MSRVLNALSWGGSGVMVSLFVVADSVAPLGLDFKVGPVAPAKVRVYEHLLEQTL